MKALLGLTAAASLAVGVFSVAPASGDHIPTFLSSDGQVCGINLNVGQGVFGLTNDVKMFERGEPIYGGDGGFASYICRFEGLQQYVDGGRDTTVPYRPTRGRPLTTSISCGTSYDPPFVDGTLKVFRNGTALLKCGLGG